MHHYNSTQYCSTETVFLIFPFIQTNITSQVRLCWGKRVSFLILTERQWLLGTVVCLDPRMYSLCWTTLHQPTVNATKLLRPAKIIMRPSPKRLHYALYPSVCLSVRLSVSTSLCHLLNVPTHHCADVLFKVNDTELGPHPFVLRESKQGWKFQLLFQLWLLVIISF